METLQKQTLPVGEAKLTYFQEDSHVSHSLSQAEERERQMTVTSGRKCSGLYRRYDRLGLLVRTLLESPAWYNPGRRLLWQATAPFLERRTLKRYSDRSSFLKQSVEILSVQDIPSSRLLFRLVPSELLTAGTESGSSPRKIPHLLPTPVASDASVGGIIGTKDKFVTTSNGTFRKINRNGKNGSVGLARMSRLLLTPRANKVNGIDLNNPLIAQRNKGNLEEVVAKIIQGTPCEAGRISRLNPLFVEEMMGFPLMWTSCPFLSQNGGPNP